jgi:hypothetical protein
VLEVVQIRVDVRKVMLDFLGQVLSIPDPNAGFTGAGRFVVAQTPVQRLNQLDAFAQRLAELLGRLVVAVHEVFQAMIPAAASTAVAVITAFAGGFVEIFVGVVSACDELPDQQSGISERFY